MRSLAVLAAAAAILLAACGGGGGDDGDGDGGDDLGGGTSTASDEQVLAYLAASNTDSIWTSATGIPMRWALPVPVKTNGDERAVAAMDEIEARLGYKVFDRTAIEDAPEAEITRGLVFSKGTVFSSPGTAPENACGNVSDAPNSGALNTETMFRLEGGEPTSELAGRLYVNLDTPGGCTASLAVTIHELGHALGLLWNEFEGFGIGSPISPDFWVVLATLYGNDIGTPQADFVVVRP